MKLSVATATFFAALVCFRVCHAQDDLTQVTSVPEFEATIWTVELVNVPPSDRVDHFAIRPTKSAALISRNLLLAIEENPIANPPATFAATVLKTNLYTSTSLIFLNLTRVSFPVQESDPTSVKLAVYRVTPAFDAEDSRLKPITISASRTTPDERCAVTIWKLDNILYTATRTVLNTTVCANGADAFFCVNSRSTDIDLMQLEGGLIVCNSQLAGLYSPRIPTVAATRSFLGLAPFRERLERIILDNAPPAPTTPPAPAHSPKATASAVLCLVFAGLLTTSGVW